MTLTRDARRILLAQALRAGAYGLGAVLLGTTLEQRGLSTAQVGLVLAAVVAGTVGATLAVGRWGDRFGRRRTYAVLFVVLAATGVVLAEARPLWLLLVAALAGAMSTDVVDQGPFAALEQSMLSSDLDGPQRLRAFGRYNAIAAVGGSLGALAAGLPALLGTGERPWFWLFVPVGVAGAAIAVTLSPRVDAAPSPGPRTRGLGASRPAVLRLSALFAVDAFAGGFVVQSFIAFWLARRFEVSTAATGAIFAGLGVLQTLSFLAASAIGARLGLLRTMVVTHLPSNVFLAALAFAPNVAIAVALLSVRALLGQMDVPTRQAYVMALVRPEERTAAAAMTGTARFIARPAAPALGGLLAVTWLGAPFVVAGALKIAYDLTIWRWFRRVPLPDEDVPTAP